MRSLILVLIATSSLVADNIMLINDSMYPLRVEIYNATGAKEITLNLVAGQTYTWNKNDSAWIPQYNDTYSPYVVRWFCTSTQPFDYNQTPKNRKLTEKERQEQKKYNSEYGTWTNVPSGATVNAMASVNGNKTCVIKKEEKKPPSKNKPPVRKPPGGLTDWRNDGGETYGNDSGPGWETQLEQKSEEEE